MPRTQTNWPEGVRAILDDDTVPQRERLWTVVGYVVQELALQDGRPGLADLERLIRDVRATEDSWR